MHASVSRTATALRACRRVLPFCLLLLALGCKGSRQTDLTDISGKVLYKGQPVPGGVVTFQPVKGGTAGTADIDEQGNYKGTAPVGEVKIGVDNRMLEKRRGTPAKTPHPHRPGSEEEAPRKGRYIDIPKKYYSPEESGLIYKVEKGANQHDIKLD